MCKSGSQVPERRVASPEVGTLDAANKGAPLVTAPGCVSRDKETFLKSIHGFF